MPLAGSCFRLLGIRSNTFLFSTGTNLQSVRCGWTMSSEVQGESTAHTDDTITRHRRGVDELARPLACTTHPTTHTGYTNFHTIERSQIHYTGMTTSSYYI